MAIVKAKKSRRPRPTQAQRHQIAGELAVARAKGLSWGYLARTYGLHRATLWRFLRDAEASAAPFTATPLGTAAQASPHQEAPASTR